MNRCVLLCLMLCLWLPNPASARPSIMTAADLAGFANPAPDLRIAYGEDALQFGELRLPPGEGPHPVMVFVHGGCWLSDYDIAHSRKLTQAFADAGIATWSLEYRRVGDPGGGWPGSFDDVAAGADYLQQIAELHRLDLGRVLFAGHSAGAQLALWLAARPQQPKPSGRGVEPLQGVGVLALAPAADLGYLHEQAVCDGVIDKLMGGSPRQFPVRYAQVDPSKLSRLDVPQRLVIGAHDQSWAAVGRRYFDTASERGDPVVVVEAEQSGHFEMIDPDSTTWPLVLDAARALLAIEAAEATAEDAADNAAPADQGAD